MSALELCLQILFVKCAVPETGEKHKCGGGVLDQHRHLAGPQWCQCWRLCFVFSVSSAWLLHAADSWRTLVLADLPGTIQCL